MRAIRVIWVIVGFGMLIKYSPSVSMKLAGIELVVADPGLLERAMGYLGGLLFLIVGFDFPARRRTLWPALAVVVDIVAIAAGIHGGTQVPMRLLAAMVMRLCLLLATHAVADASVDATRSRSSAWWLLPIVLFVGWAASGIWMSERMHAAQGELDTVVAQLQAAQNSRDSTAFVERMLDCGWSDQNVAMFDTANAEHRSRYGACSLTVGSVDQALDNGTHVARFRAYARCESGEGFYRLMTTTVDQKTCVQEIQFISATPQ